MEQNLSDMWRYTFEIGEASLRQISRQNHRPCLWTEALSGMSFVAAQKLSGIAGK